MINYHHIGGRNGTYPLPLKLGPLLQDFHLVLYDADTNCFEQMGKANQGDWGKISVYPYCIGGKTQKAPFHLNFHPTTNSLYPFNEEYSSYGYINNPRYGEYLLGDACKHLETIHLDLFSLPDVLKQTDITSVDFLSLDVQGAEFDILEGAETILQTQCIGIQLEAEFVKLYSNQKTFANITILLEKMGFELIEIDGFGRCAPISIPIGYRGAEQVLSAEAIYIKKLDYLVKNGSVDQIWKGAFFNLLYKKIGLCLKFISKAIEMGGEIKGSNIPLYKKLLLEIWDQYKKDRGYLIPTIGQLFSHEAFQVFYQKGKTADLSQDESLKKQIDQLVPYVENLKSVEQSPFELILNKYHLYDVAEVAKKSRLYEIGIFSDLAKCFV